MRILSLGNYARDGQESMLRFAALLRQQLPARGVELRPCDPAVGLGRLTGSTVQGAGKWFGYLDKYVGFPAALAWRLRRDAPAVVHIADHSNALYVPWIRRMAPRVRVVVTCHDLLAVRYALEEADAEYRIGSTGRAQQRAILAGLQQADLVVCDSEATRRDAERLVTRGQARPELRVVPLCLNQPYRALPRDEAWARLRQAAPTVPQDQPWILHVGSSQPRKNRPLLLRLLAALSEIPLIAVFAGERLTAAQWALARELGVADRVVEVPGPDEPTLEALYSAATALVFPSRAEGFGWPILEAQACDCPVICSDVEPLPEVAGPGGAWVVGLDDVPGYAAAVRAVLRTPEATRPAARANVARHAPEIMLDAYLDAFAAALRL
ncbi:MAG: glycosyltransferase [Verrucomicrobia bacterium]|nr:glycosyltransferase [Verrucomicrobiota bacterium]